MCLTRKGYADARNGYPGQKLVNSQCVHDGLACGHHEHDATAESTADGRFRDLTYVHGREQKKEASSKPCFSVDNVQKLHKKC